MAPSDQLRTRQPAATVTGNGSGRPSPRSTGRGGRAKLSVAVVFGVLTMAACSGASHQKSQATTKSSGGIPDPSLSLSPTPDYAQSCAMSGLDNTAGCIQVTLAAIDHARAQEKLPPMKLPANYASLPFNEQFLIVVDAERVDRDLPPVTGVTKALDDVAGQGVAVNDLPPDPGSSYLGTQLEVDAGFYNALDIDYQWLYNDGPGSQTSGCTNAGDSGCWADRHIVLAGFPSNGTLVMGAADNPTGDNQDADKGGAVMAAVIAGTVGPIDATVYSWNQALNSIGQAGLVPLSTAPAGISATGIADPAHTEPANPDFTKSCTQEGIDNSAPCLQSALQAINNARAAENVKAMVLPPDFAKLSIPDQLFVVLNLERVDRGLPPFVGLGSEANANAQKGADTANDPPDPSNVLGADGEWTGGSVNGLDADYGWMYDDGRGSSNIDCPRTGGGGCWGHREGILDNYGTVGTMVMGAALNPTGDSAANGDQGGTSMAVTLEVTPSAPAGYTYTWTHAQADLAQVP